MQPTPAICKAPPLPEPPGTPIPLIQAWARFDGTRRTYQPFLAETTLSLRRTQLIPSWIFEGHTLDPANNAHLVVTHWVDTEDWLVTAWHVDLQGITWTAGEIFPLGLSLPTKSGTLWLPTPPGWQLDVTVELLL